MHILFATMGFLRGKAASTLGQDQVSMLQITLQPVFLLRKIARQLKQVYN
jgi:hypothetical protein